MKSIKFLFLFSWIICASVFVACGGDGSHTEQTEETANTDDATETSSPQVQLTDFTSSPEFADATISVEVANNKFDYAVGGNYQLGDQTPDAPQKMCANSGKGQHIHLIVDDLPYAAKYEPSFEHEVADGEHYVLSFLSRSYHESIKTDAAHVAFKATFEGGTPKDRAAIEDPMLFYSRPKGTYVGKENTEKVMLDFYLLNTNLDGAGNKVKIEVNGESTFTVDEWKPYFLEGLPMGDNKIKLTLLGPDGNPLDIPLNPVERVFTLKADPAEG